MTPEVDLRGECAAVGCHERIPFGRLMCYPCWVSVPKELRIRVYNTWRTRLARPHDPQSIFAHEQAKHAAVMALVESRGAALEGVE